MVLRQRRQEELARACAGAGMIWRKAREEADFAAFRPALEEVVRLTRQEARAKAEALPLAPYCDHLEARYLG